jgi:YesN/AraC family two-component response regulator
MLKIVIVEPETFRLLGIKGAISQSPDIEITGDATSGKLGFQLIEQTNPDVVLVDLLLPVPHTTRSKRSVPTSPWHHQIMRLK